MRLALPFILLGALVSLSCVDAGNPLEPPVKLDYAQGQVMVYLADTVRYSFAHSFFQGLGIQPVYIVADGPVTVVVLVDSGFLDTPVTRLMQDTAVISVFAEHQNWGDRTSKWQIQVIFRGTVRLPYARSLIDSIPGLTWMWGWASPQYALVYVEVGQENVWIKKFEQYSFVTRATLSYLRRE